MTVIVIAVLFVLCLSLVLPSRRQDNPPNHVHIHITNNLTNQPAERGNSNDRTEEKNAYDVTNTKRW